MATLPMNIVKTRVLASTTLVAATPQDTSFVDVQGAKEVHYLVRSTTAGETDAFTAPSVLAKVSLDSGASLVVASAAALNAMGVIAPNIASCVTAGNQGYCLSIYPMGSGITPFNMAENARFGVEQMALRLGAHATNDISTVVVDVVVVY